MFGKCPCCLATGTNSKYECDSIDQTDTFTKTGMSLKKKLTVSAASPCKGCERGFERKTWESSVVLEFWQLLILAITAVWPAICFPENSEKLHVIHYSDIIMSAMASQTTGVLIVYSTNCSDADLRKHQSSMSLAFVWGIHRWPVNSPHKGPVTWKMFPFDDVIMSFSYEHYIWLFWFMYKSFSNWFNAKMSMDRTEKMQIFEGWNKSGVWWNKKLFCVSIN